MRDAASAKVQTAQAVGAGGNGRVSGPIAVPDGAAGPAPTPGRPDRLLPGLVRLTAPNPGMMTGPGTNTYLIGTGDLAVVDPGPDDAADYIQRHLAFDRVSLDVPWIEVDTTSGYYPGIDQVVAFINGS